MNFIRGDSNYCVCSAPNSSNPFYVNRALKCTLPKSNDSNDSNRNTSSWVWIASSSSSSWPKHESIHQALFVSKQNGSPISFRKCATRNKNQTPVPTRFLSYYISSRENDFHPFLAVCLLLDNSIVNRWLSKCLSMLLRFTTEPNRLVRNNELRQLMYLRSGIRCMKIISYRAFHWACEEWNEH